MLRFTGVERVGKAKNVDLIGEGDWLRRGEEEGEEEDVVGG